MAPYKASASIPIVMVKKELNFFVNLNIKSSILIVDSPGIKPTCLNTANIKVTMSK